MAKLIEWGKVQEALQQVVIREVDGGWVLVGYRDWSANAPHELQLLATGTGGAAELQIQLQEDNTFAYGLIRVANASELSHRYDV